VSRRYHIGLDDTDAGESIGTGALARELRIHLLQRFGGAAGGITRHQLLVHPDIPYTSHNSANCLVVELDAPPAAVAAACAELIRFLHHDGADPGLCVVARATLSPAALDFARRAQREIVRKDEALAVGRGEGVHLEELGGTGLGVIGALAACALRLSGDDGRFVALEGVRDLKGDLTVAAIRARAPIDRVVDDAGAELGPDCVIQTNGWVRPGLTGGAVVLRVTRQDGRYVIVNRKREEE
jgi:tRNA(Ile2) C34 agmatinyltransferase TiaS